MPRLSVWAIKSALIAMAVGFTLGALLLANKGVPFLPVIWALLPIHIELVLVGWTVQLAFGVVYWILPRWIGGSRGSQPLAWLALGLLNLGMLLTMIGVWPIAPGWLPLAGRACELGAAGAFLLQVWSRVRPFVQER